MAPLCHYPLNINNSCKLLFNPITLYNTRTESSQTQQKSIRFDSFTRLNFPQNLKPLVFLKKWEGFDSFTHLQFPFNPQPILPLEPSSSPSQTQQNSIGFNSFTTLNFPQNLKPLFLLKKWKEFDSFTHLQFPLNPQPILPLEPSSSPSRTHQNSIEFDSFTSLNFPQNLNPLFSLKSWEIFDSFTRLHFPHNPQPILPPEPPSTPPSSSPCNSPPPPPPPPTPPPPPRGAKPIPLLTSLATGLFVVFLVPKPEELTSQAWHLLAIFLTTISGLILTPLPIAAWAFLCLTFATLSKTITVSAAFNTFANEVIWLVAISFFLARGFVKTGLGERVGNYFVKWLGKSTLGLSYGLCFSDALIAPAMPSTTARAGGIFLPIIKSLALSVGSRPNHPSSKKLGSYLIQSQLQCSSSSSALFLTAAAQNLLCLKLAEALGVVVENPWVSWFVAASLPGFVSLLATPLILYALYPPEIKDTPDAPAMAAKKLDLMGPVTRNEWIMIGTMFLAAFLWVCGDAFGIPSVVAAMLGLSILLLLGVLDWDDCLSETAAWDTLVWFAVLVGMAGQLTDLGIISWMSNGVSELLESLSLSWPAAFGVLQATYFLIHYLFASQTGHVGALYSAFLAMHSAAGVPGVLSALALALNTNLFGALTHYSSGQAAVYFGAGYVDLPDVFKVGFIMALVNAAIWGIVGTFWWKFLGLY